MYLFFRIWISSCVFQSRVARQEPRTHRAESMLSAWSHWRRAPGRASDSTCFHALFFADKSLTSRFKHCDSKPLALERGCSSKPGKSSTNNDNARLGLLAANAGGDCGEGEQGRVMHWINNFVVEFIENLGKHLLCIVNEELKDHAMA